MKDIKIRFLNHDGQWYAYSRTHLGYSRIPVYGAETEFPFIVTRDGVHRTLSPEFAAKLHAAM